MIRRNFKKLKAWKPSISTVIAVIIIAGGMAFAFLQSQAKLTGNSIETGTAGLYISQNDTNYSTSTSGYDFAGVIPGSQASQTQHFFLKNTGNAALSLKISDASTPANPNNVDLSKVNVILTPYSTTTFMPGTPQSFSLQSLVDANTSGGLNIDYPASLSPGTKEEFNIQVAMNADAVNGPGAALSNIDLAFTGVATSAN
jgi:archaellum component FlaG (FlaF/FlaG flagellin family)